MRNRQLLVSIALVLFLVGYGFWEIRRHVASKPPFGQAYFYNVATKTLFSASDQLLPPIDTESGPDTGVRAYVFRCSNSTNQGDHFIAYLEKMTSEGKAAALQELKNDRSPATLGFFQDRHRDAIVVRSLQDETWHPKLSPEGGTLMAAGLNSGGCDHPILCLP